MKGEALGKLMGGVLLASVAVGGAVGKVTSKLGRWEKVAKLKTSPGRIGKKGGVRTVQSSSKSFYTFSRRFIE